MVSDGFGNELKMCTNLDNNKALITAILPIMVRCLRFHCKISFSMEGSFFSMFVAGAALAS